MKLTKSIAELNGSSCADSYCSRISAQHALQAKPGNLNQQRKQARQRGPRLDINALLPYSTGSPWATRRTRRLRSGKEAGHALRRNARVPHLGVHATLQSQHVVVTQRVEPLEAPQGLSVARVVHILPAVPRAPHVTSLRSIGHCVGNGICMAWQVACSVHQDGGHAMVRPGLPSPAPQVGTQDQGLACNLPVCLEALGAAQAGRHVHVGVRVAPIGVEVISVSTEGQYDGSRQGIC